jgi:hypothetical protein
MLYVQTAYLQHGISFITPIAHQPSYRSPTFSSVSPRPSLSCPLLWTVTCLHLYSPRPLHASVRPLLLLVGHRSPVFLLGLLGHCLPVPRLSAVACLCLYSPMLSLACPLLSSLGCPFSLLYALLGIYVRCTRVSHFAKLKANLYIYPFALVSPNVGD